MKQYLLLVAITTKRLRALKHKEPLQINQKRGNNTMEKIANDTHSSQKKKKLKRHRFVVLPTPLVVVEIQHFMIFKMIILNWNEDF